MVIGCPPHFTQEATGGGGGGGGGGVTTVMVTDWLAAPQVIFMVVVACSGPVLRLPAAGTTKDCPSDENVQEAALDDQVSVAAAPGVSTAGVAVRVTATAGGTYAQACSSGSCAVGVHVAGDVLAIERVCLPAAGHVVGDQALYE